MFSAPQVRDANVFARIPEKFSAAGRSAIWVDTQSV